MKLRTIATGSSGNSYLLYDDRECLIIEMGMPFMEVKKALDFDFLKIVGGVCSHEHKDHFGRHKEYDAAGIKIFYPFQTDKKSVQYGGFKVRSFDNPHGDSTSYGFIISHRDIGKLCFVTDAEYVKYDFSKLNLSHLMVECNYDTRYVDMDAPNFRHKVEGHMNLDTCREFVRHNASPELRSVVLIHGSNAVNPADATQAIKNIVDPDVIVEYAVKGLEMELKKEVL